MTKIYFPQSGMISLLVVAKEGRSYRDGHRRTRRRGRSTRCVRRAAFIHPHHNAGWRNIFDHWRQRVCTNRTAKRAAADLITRYTEVLWAEAQQLAACDAVHEAPAWLCRWLLQCADRIGSDQLPLTQELIAQMLGVRRTTITLLARSLQQRGLIKYARGKITILDRKALEHCACECYDVLQQEKLPFKIGVTLQ